MIPGESISVTFEATSQVCNVFVWPGRIDIEKCFSPTRVFIIDDFPTFVCPTKPIRTPPSLSELLRLWFGGSWLSFNMCSVLSHSSKDSSGKSFCTTLPSSTGPSCEPNWFPYLTVLWLNQALLHDLLLPRPFLLNVFVFSVWKPVKAGESDNIQIWILCCEVALPGNIDLGPNQVNLRQYKNTLLFEL